MRSPSKPPAAGTRDWASPGADDSPRCFFNNNLWYRRRSAGPMTRPLWEETLPMARNSTPARTPCPQPPGLAAFPFVLVLARPSARIGQMSGPATKTCVSCRGGVPPLKAEELAALGKQVDGWNVIEEHHITKTFKFPNFREALKFVNQVGNLAEEQGHHPDIFLAWGKVEITSWTHKINGLTESDFILAAKIDHLYKS